MISKGLLDTEYWSNTENSALHKNKLQCYVYYSYRKQLFLIVIILNIMMYYTWINNTALVSIRGVLTQTL